MTGRRWAYCGALLGGVVSIAANVAHSYVPPATAPAGWRPHAGAVFGAVFWPVALFVAIEILARVPWPAGGRWLAVRYLGLLPVAVVAAVVSYRHLSGLLAFYGEDDLTTVIGPLAVDGLMVMATGALIATGARLAVPADPAGSAAEPMPDLPKPAASGMPDGTPRRRPAKAAGRANDSATKVARAHAKWPDATRAELAKRAGVSVRTVARHRPATGPDSTDATRRANGAEVVGVLAATGGRDA